MSFQIPDYVAPNFSDEALRAAPDAVLTPAPANFVTPEEYHATSISG